ncbi:MAG TPA: hypothetical protein VMF52_10090 [Steroidobacteraceae bacterium]|nr:hypothetical protein [Steroidobacteraceae bacterium]
MKAVMRELAQAKRHYSTLPLFEFLRDERLGLRDRLAFLPVMAPFVLASADLDRCVFRDESSPDPVQRLVDARTRENGREASWYLEDYTKLGFDRIGPVTQQLRATLRDSWQQNRLLVPRLAQLAYRATPAEKLVIVESIAQSGHVLFGLTAPLAARLAEQGGPELRYLGQLHVAREAGHASRGLDPHDLEAIPLSAVERVRCLDLAFRVFDLFADWSNELHLFARQALAPRAPMQIVVHGRTA